MSEKMKGKGDTEEEENNLNGVQKKRLCNGCRRRDKVEWMSFVP
jgi:hypothetical protein